jgi:hypothetical protein
MRPGVDLEHFRPGEAGGARTRLGVRRRRAAVRRAPATAQGARRPMPPARLLERGRPSPAAFPLPSAGGTSVNRLHEPASLPLLAAELDTPPSLWEAALTAFGPPADWYAAAVSPSPHNRSAEQRVAGGPAGLRHPVVATRVGGLRTTVAGVKAASGRQASADATGRSLAEASVTGRSSPGAVARRQFTAKNRCRAFTRPTRPRAVRGGNARECCRRPSAAPPVVDIRTCREEPRSGGQWRSCPAPASCSANACGWSSGQHFCSSKTFVCRQPDARNHEGLPTAFLPLRHAARAHQLRIAFTLDDEAGDVTSSAPALMITPDEVDHISGRSCNTPTLRPVAGDRFPSARSAHPVGPPARQG